MESLVLTLGSQCVWLPCWCGGRREWRDDHPDWQWRNSGAWLDLSEITVQVEGGGGEERGSNSHRLRFSVEDLQDSAHALM